MNEKESWKSKISLQDETDEVYCQEECHMGKVLQINSIYFLWKKNQIWSTGI